MRAAILASALLLLIGSAPAGWAADPAGATVVLRLPASMPPAMVERLIADLAAKGARTDPVVDATRSEPVSTTANLAARVWEATGRALRAIPVFRHAPQRWFEQVGAEGAAVWFWVVGLAGLIAAPLIGHAFRGLLDRRQRRVSEAGMAPRLRAGAIRFQVAVASLAVFGIIFWAALLAVSSGRLAA